MVKFHRKKRVLISGLSLAALLGMFFFLLYARIPNRCLVSEGEHIQKLFDLPFIEEQVVAADSQPSSNIPSGKVKIQCSFLGMVPIKNVEVQIVPKSRVYPGGMPVGIYMKTKGILVVGTGAVDGADGAVYEPSENILKSGDYIMAVNDCAVSQKEELIREVNHCGGAPVVLKVNRGGSQTELLVSPAQTGNEEYKLGLWVRDDTQGIGTLTYLDAEGNYGALGHGISDVDTGTLMNLSGGTLYHTEILSVIRGMKGSPGEMAGLIRYKNSEVLGTIDANTEKGIFGKITRRQEELIKREPVEIAYKQEVEPGPATILSAVDGEVKEYSVQIEKVRLNSQEPNKSMIISITDPELLSKTGGIIQGMSGSPILQKGKLIGAVTHVFIQDAAKGYGIFIENMLEH